MELGEERAMSHEVRLLVASWSGQCARAKLFWRALSDKAGFAYEEVDIDSPAGNALASRFGIRNVPAAVVDDCLVLRAQLKEDILTQLFEEPVG